VEEKIYRRQVFKGGLAKATVNDANPSRYFSGGDLRDLFAVTEQGLDESETAAQLAEVHGADAGCPDDVKRHLAKLTKIEYFQTTSDHTLLFKHDEQRGEGNAQAPWLFEAAPGQGASAGGGRAPA
jgi:DNA excision repair protein ERCC-6-like